MININTRLKKLRKDKKLTQQQLADLFGMGISSICSYESGDRKPSYAVLKQYVSHFHVSSDYILGFDKRETIDVTGLSDSEIDSIKMLVTKYKENKKNK